ncbi:MULTISPECIES: NYN domain-containing protein [unclassified Cyanobium]|uniref:NYN domain-containing protein n=1 Tax=unclassified Cyanobium TaxID=2627006 RepID=UPI0020CD01E6|nr:MULTISPECIES: NYN domain-containing protein [unclassified Cyanobium]MCP9796938.1 NYN domain-containing protein [Cyanobium sp. Lug-B]MCP9933153.1 NYN domain-containing protein [Cyanobium sp. Candia 9D4]
MRSPSGAQPPAGGLAEDTGRRLAVLIDADNARAAVIEAVLEEVARFGEAIVRRIYGDFTSSQSASWKALLNKFSIKPMQQFAYTVGKNATDSTMIIDAMDLLYTRRFDGFCLVTSDSDFTGLAVRLREEGLLVYGFGEEKTPAAFRNACHKFLFTEVLRTASRQGEISDGAGEARRARDAEPPASAHPVIPADFLMEALDRSVDESGWTQLGTFGSYLQKIQPDFDTRLYGFRKLSDLVRGCPSLFVMEEREAPSGNRTIVYVRAREDD